jgi:hypothetical protein
MVALVAGLAGIKRGINLGLMGGGGEVAGAIEEGDKA